MKRCRSRSFFLLVARLQSRVIDQSAARGSSHPTPCLLCIARRACGEYPFRPCRRGARTERLLRQRCPASDDSLSLDSCNLDLSFPGRSPPPLSSPPRARAPPASLPLPLRKTKPPAAAAPPPNAPRSSEPSPLCRAPRGTAGAICPWSERLSLSSSTTFVLRSSARGGTARSFGRRCTA